MSITYDTHPNRKIEKEIARIEELYFFYEERFWASKSARIREFYERKMRAISYQVAQMEDQLTAEDYE